jgi:GH18 family chitinase
LRRSPPLYGTTSPGSASYDDIAQAPYIYDGGRRRYLGFENERSLKAKLDYAKDKNLGGIMVWAIDQDDDKNTLLKLIATSNICGGGKEEVNYKCSPIDEQRWWTLEDDKVSYDA